MAVRENTTTLAETTNRRCIRTMKPSMCSQYHAIAGTRPNSTQLPLFMARASEYADYMPRVVILFLTALALASAQPPAADLKAGDPAPQVQPVKVIQSPYSGPWDWAAMRGKVVVLEMAQGFMTEDTRWNDLVAKSQGQPVEFVILTGEPQSNLERILHERPLSGWIGLD